MASSTGMTSQSIDWKRTSSRHVVRMMPNHTRGPEASERFMGYVASQKELNREVLKRALFYGGVMGSFAVERFGTERLQCLSREEIDARFQIFRELTHLE